MNVFVLTQQGMYVDVFLSREAAEARKQSLYMGGGNGLHIHEREL